MEMPIYLFTGYLEAGKTKFIQETLEDKRFNTGEKILVILCEQGIEELVFSAVFHILLAVIIHFDMRRRENA